MASSTIPRKGVLAENTQKDPRNPPSSRRLNAVAAESTTEDLVLVVEENLSQNQQPLGSLRCADVRRPVLKCLLMPNFDFVPVMICMYSF